MNSFVIFAIVGLSFVGTGLCQYQFPNYAFAKIVPGSQTYVQGQLEIHQVYDGVQIQGYIGGLTPGHHGFHIHEKGRLGNQCKDAGPHFNPFRQTHGDPRDIVRHVGDLGNIYADSTGTAYIKIFDQKASLDPYSQAYIGNRAFVVHAKPDDLGNGNNDESLKTGNAGSRVGCGIITVEQQRYRTPQTVQYQPFQPSYNYGGYLSYNSASRRPTFHSSRRPAFHYPQQVHPRSPFYPFV